MEFRKERIQINSTKRERFSFNYTGGYLPFTQLMETSTLNMVVTIYEDGVEFLHTQFIKKMFKREQQVFTLFVPFNEISDVNIKYGETIEKVKEKKSIVKRSLVGGIVFGAIGAVIGGMTALDKQISEKKSAKVEIEFTFESATNNHLFLNTLIDNQSGIDRIERMIELLK